MKVIFYLSILFTFLLSTITGTAQVRCGSDQVREKLIAEHPGYKKSLEDMDAGIRQYIATHPPESTSFTNGTLSTLYYIPCVVHVIYDTDPTVGSQYNPSVTQINNAISYINQVYDGTWTGTGGAILGVGDLQIKFVLATKDPSNAATTGIDRISGASISGYSTYGMKLQGTNGAAELTVKNLSRWDPEKYYNIWTVNKIDGCDGYGGCGSFVAGYAYFPMDPASTLASDFNLDGTLMLASQFAAGQKTLPHELGHMLNLYHVFQGNDPSGTGANACPTNPLLDDQCADTDPVNNPTLAPNAVPFACRSGANTCGGPYGDNTEKNFMNYTNCYQLFTANQKTRMQASLASTQRTSLATSWVNNQGAYPATFAAPIAATSTPSSTLTANNISGVTNISLNGKTVYSLNATQDGGYLNNSGKWYDAFQLTASSPYTLTVTIFNNGNRAQLGAWIDYDNNGTFNSTNEQLSLQTDVVGSTTIFTINFNTPAGWAGKSNFVRMRISTDLSTVYGISPVSATSSSLAYGQAEDYPVYLSGGVVPVSLISFTGKQNKDAINLAWNTAQEINTDSYDIERSIKAGSFETIGNVHATGSAIGAQYTFRDADIARAGDYLYRLKIKDLDGSFNYSNILKFTVQERKQLIVIGNPFTDQLNMLLPYSDGTGAFRLLDATGRLVYSNTIAINGSPSASLKMQNNLPAGVYILEAVINGERFTQKVFKK